MKWIIYIYIYIKFLLNIFVDIENDEEEALEEVDLENFGDPFAHLAFLDFILRDE